MAIQQRDILKYSIQKTTSAVSEAVRVAKASSQQTAFLCHSHKDNKLALGLQGWLKSQGWDVYIDWQDESMQHSPNKQTAKNIQNHIETRDWFLYLATQNSSNSKWCPWEIGYADGIGKTTDIIVVPTSFGYDSYGQEYLDLYRSVKNITAGGYAIFEAARNRGGIRLNSLRR